MSRVSRYVLRQLVLGMIATTVVLAGILWLANSVRFVELLINRGISATTFLYLTMLSVPNLLNFTLPIASFAVVGFIYSKLNTDRELVVLRAAGVSPYTIAKPAIILGLILTTISYAFSFYLTPSSFKRFRELQWEIRYDFSQALLQAGEFNTLGKDFTIYFRERVGEADLRGVLVHDNRDHNAPITYIAQRGVLVDGDKGPRVIVFDGSRQQYEKATGKIYFLEFDRTPIELGGLVQRPPFRYREPREISTPELFGLKMSDVGGSHDDYGRFRVELHNRMTSPLLVMAFILVTVVSMVIGDFSRRGQWRRIVLATAVNIGIAVSLLSVGNLAMADLNLIPLIYLGSTVPLVAAGLLLFWQPRLRLRFAAAAGGG